LPVLGFDKILEMGPVESVRILTRERPEVLAVLSFDLVSKVDCLKRENERLAAEYKKVLLANVESKRCRLKAVAETNAYADGNRKLLDLLSKALAGSEISTDEIANEIDRLKDVMGKPKKDSRTSSSKPSADSPRSKGEQKKARELKKNGDPKGRPGPLMGHEPKNRPPLDEKDIENAVVHDVEEKVCPDCGGHLEHNPKNDELVEQLDIPPNCIERTVHRVKGYVCDKCGHHHSNRPAELRTGLIGPALLALLAVLKFGGHVSFGGLQKVLAALGAHVTKGCLSKALNRVSESVKRPVEELLCKLPAQKVVNADESSHKENGNRMWVWTFVAATFTVFVISPTRACSVLEVVLGASFSGVLGSDFYGAYTLFKKKCAGVVMQLCWAHLVRSLKNLTENYIGYRRQYGLRLLELKNEIFRLHHLLKEEPCRIDLFFRLQIRAAEFLRHSLERAALNDKECGKIAKRMIKYGHAYFTFIYRRDVEPTNNSAEQSIRYLVIDRVVTFGTRSESGRDRLARMMTVIATCRKRNASSYDYILKCITAWCKKEEPPSMLDL
jgi:transposase